MPERKESVEDYLEEILMLENQKEHVHSVDIARIMNYSKASVSIAIRKLVAENLVDHDLNSNEITLTKKGREIAEKTYDRHVTLSTFFESLGVSKEQALNDACKIEHDLSDETYLKLKEYIQSNPK